MSSTQTTPDQLYASLLGEMLKDLQSVEVLKAERPALAHYTSISNLKSILTSDQIWFSNPLFMNDLQEMNYGIAKALEFIQSAKFVVRAIGRQEIDFFVEHHFGAIASHFYQHHAPDVYVFCLTEHDKEAKDGLLSMWRAYSPPGQGAAIIFNTGFVTEKADSPVIIAKVRYVSEEKRHLLLLELAERWRGKVAELSVGDLFDDHLKVLAYSLFDAVKLFALTTKHLGFLEEQEWRLIYMPDRDPFGFLQQYYGYHVGNRGIEPKLKLPLRPLPLLNPEGWVFDDIVDEIIFGPGMHEQLHGGAFRRLFEECGKATLSKRVRFSTIPLRVG